MTTGNRTNPEVIPLRPLRVLLVEDSEDDVALLVEKLRMGGFAPDWLRVQTAAGVRAALAQRQWGIVLADYVMPSFSASAALSLLQQSNLDLPFMIVSGVMREWQP